MDIELIIDVLKDACIDTLKLVPFLFVTYLAMEALEHAAADKTERLVAGAGKAGPAVGSLLGALPQCGFSAMAATLYAGRVVTVGTLVAVILSTSDEMIPVFVAHQESFSRLFTILAIKVAVGMVVGFSVDAVLRALRKSGDGKPHIEELCERAHCHCDEDETQEALADVLHEGHEHDHCGCGHSHGHSHGHGGLGHIARSALIHTAQVTAFIFLVTFVFGLIIEGVGEETIGMLLSDHPVRATLLAGLIGLIPNCGASVAISELYLAGTLPTGAMMAGLLVSGGVGLLVLFRTNADMRQNLIITGFLYVVGVVCGLLVGASGILL